MLNADSPGCWWARAVHDEVSMPDRADALRECTMHFALRIVSLCRTLPSSWESRHVAAQLFRSGTSVAANYRAACRARSRREFISKLGIGAEEADETVFWLMLLMRSGIDGSDAVQEALDEAKELLAIFIASIKTANANRDQSHG
jgi:four helix bundle protein